MAARKTTPKLDEDLVGIPVDEDTTEPVKAARKPREVKPVTDLATANAAFLKAKAKAYTANKRADEAKTQAFNANADVTAAAKVLKGYMDEVDDAVQAALPQSFEAPAEDHGDHSEYDQDPYEGDGHGDTAHTV